MTILERLEAKRKINSETGCWEWTGKIDRYGYGRISIGKRNWKGVHRISYELLVGKIPEKLCVCHTCDNPICFNPDHLWIGTFLENVKDRVNKCRSGIDKNRHGSRCSYAKLTEDQVIEIKKKYIPWKYPLRVLAAEYGVHLATIGYAITGRNWKHVQ